MVERSRNLAYYIRTKRSNFGGVGIPRLVGQEPRRTQSDPPHPTYVGGGWVLLRARAGKLGLKYYVIIA
jgi:hypothetical protein